MYDLKSGPYFGSPPPSRFPILRLSSILPIFAPLARDFLDVVAFYGNFADFCVSFAPWEVGVGWGGVAEHLEERSLRSFSNRCFMMRLRDVTRPLVLIIECRLVECADIVLSNTSREKFLFSPTAFGTMWGGNVRTFLTVLKQNPIVRIFIVR